LIYSQIARAAGFGDAKNKYEINGAEGWIRTNGAINNLAYKASPIDHYGTSA